jgi:hypothetical protein
MAKKIVLKNAVKRQKGKMYFVDGSGNLCETTMSKGRKKKSSSSSSKKKKAPAKKKPAKSKAKKKTTKKKS